MEDTRRTDNALKGKEFQIAVKECLEKRCRKGFELEHKIEIGAPPKAHKFDIASCDESVVVECKCYTWTDGGNVPSAKLAAANEAVLYMSFLPKDCEKLLVFSRAKKEGGETLAKYYARVYGSFLRDVKVMEFDMDTRLLEEIPKAK